MADVARTAIVSKENLNGLLLDDSVKSGQRGDSNDLTECSALIHTNSRSNRNSCSSAIEPREGGGGGVGGYQEIDSFSELSFRTTDEISLQDLIESEFAARMSTMNGDEFNGRTADECWDSGLNRSRDLFDDLFEEYEGEEKGAESLMGKGGRGKEYLEAEEYETKGEYHEQEEEEVERRKMRGAGQRYCTSPEVEVPEEEEEDFRSRQKSCTKSVNIFKLNGPDDIPIMTNFDPFTAIEEVSESSDSLNNPNVLNSPDEFPFPESPQEGKVVEKADDRSNAEWLEKSENQGDELFVNKSEEIVMREFFSKTVSEENLDSFAEQNYDENGAVAKFKVNNNMSSVESVNNSLPNASNVTSSEKNDVDEFYSLEDIAKSNPSLPAKTHKEKDGVAEEEEAVFKDAKFESNELKEISPPGNVDLFIDDETFDEFDDETSGEDARHGHGREDGRETDRRKGENLVKTKKFVRDQEEEEEWTTVEEALKAEPEDFELDGDSSLLNVTNQCVKESNFVGSSTNDVSGLTNSQTNGFSDSETETRSESKTTKKKKSKKGKKSDEKENISVGSTSEQTGNSSAVVSPSVAEDLGNLSNVSVKNLMLTYSSKGPKSLQKCWPGRDAEPVPLQNLKARSMVDLTSNSKKIDALRFNLFENAKNVATSRSTSNLSNPERHPVVTGVSVRALKSSFSKFDQLSKKTILHVRSVDTTKVQKQFNEASTGSAEITCNCKSCGKQVFQMEQIKAEKSVWHKNCFRCKECNKQLSVDTYSSHEGVLYCKPHFRELFKPKAVLEDDTEPASDKPDLGLEELASLNVKSRFHVFEKSEENTAETLEKSPSSVNVKRSPSILSKLAKFQKKGMDVGVRDEDLNGLPIEQSSASSEEEEEETQEEIESSRKVVKSKKVRERPMSFSKMGDVKSVWENGVPKTKEEMREERNKEIHQIRSKLFMGKQVKMKEAYEQAVRESESVSPRKSVEIRSEKAKSIKECFEKGEPLNIDDETEAEEKKKIVEDDMSLFEAGISKKSRSLFLELDKSAKTQQTAGPVKKSSPISPGTPSRNRELRLSVNGNALLASKSKALMKIFMYPQESKAENRLRKKCTFKGIGLWTNRRNNSKTKIGFYCEVCQPSENVVRSSDAIEDVKIETADISSKFKFFESYKEPEKEKKKFRITPPREGQVKTESPEKEIYRDPNVVRSCDKMEQEIIRTNTTAKMLSLFRQMEEKTEDVPEGPKPLKRFTPPPDYKEESEGESEEEESEEEEEEEINPNIIRASDKVEDEYLKQAANAARAKQLRAKFEKWEEKEKEREREENERKMNGSTTTVVTENSENVEVTSIECTKSLRARFESMRSESQQPKDKVSRPIVNRFVEIQNNLAELCDVCRRRVYQLERVETSGKIFHKTCFRCMQCNCLLRMESFTLNCGNLYCLPHFKQKFIAKGNYDEGFGVDQHKAKWPTVTSF